MMVEVDTVMESIEQYKDVSDDVKEAEEEKADDDCRVDEDLGDVGSGGVIPEPQHVFHTQNIVEHYLLK